MQLFNYRTGEYEAPRAAAEDYSDEEVKDYMPQSDYYFAKYDRLRKRGADKHTALVTVLSEVAENEQPPAAAAPAQEVSGRPGLRAVTAADVAPAEKAEKPDEPAVEEDADAPASNVVQFKPRKKE